MSRTLVLMRHGLASGQAPDAHLLPEGWQDIVRLGRVLAREGWSPSLVIASPYRRAQETTNVLLGTLGVSTPIETSASLTPECEPSEALEAIRPSAADLPCVLVVSHLPLLDSLLYAITDTMPGFSPGTFVEIALTSDAKGRVVRRIVARDLP